jgi:drug/metabolite transporter (DMT)-like permease
VALAVGLALAGGLCYATAAVLQQRVASQQAESLSLSPKLIVALLRRPLWLAGIVVDAGAYVLEAAALAAGSIVVVQPLLETGLLFAIPFATIGTGQRVTRNEMIPAAMVTAGVAVFVLVGSPQGSGSEASALGWIVVGVVIGSAVLACVAVGRRSTGGRRALFYGLGTGILYGLTAVLTKSTVDLIDAGVAQVFTHWQPYALAVCSITGLILNQSAFQAGHVAASLPVISVANPVVSCVLAVTLFGEHLDVTGVVAIASTALAVGAMIAGTLWLARSPLVTHQVEHTPAIQV